MSLTRIYCLSILLVLLAAFFDITYSSENDTLSDGRRHARVSGRIVKLYSGLKPNPVICLGEGFQKDNVDCAVFYRCLKASNGKYTVYRFQCGPGTVYDPDTEICNHPQRTKRLECGGLFSDKTTSSTKIYFDNEIEGIQKENHELPSPITTKSPIEFNTESNNIHTSKTEKVVHSYITTSYPWFTTGHTYADTNAVPTVSPFSISTSDSTKIPREVTSAQITSYAIVPSNYRDNQCSSDGFMGDTEDCRKFYRCVNNQRGGYLRYEFSCSESTVWDDDTQSCNHPWAVRRRRCGKGSSFAENSNSYGNKDMSHKLPQQEILYGSKVTPSQIETNSKPSMQNQPQINFGDRLNQDKPVKRPNQSQITYGHPESPNLIQTNYGTNEMQTQPHIDQSYQPNQVSTHTSDFSTAVPSSEHLLENKNNKCTKDGFMGDPNDCQKFYRCTLDGRGRFNRQEFSCSEGTLWDEKLEACNHAWAVKGCNRKISNIPPMSSNVSSPTNDYYTTTSSSFNNEIMDEVGYGNQNNLHEMKESKYSTQTTSARTTVNSESSKLQTSECNSGGFFGNSEDCAKFYRCVENGRGGFTKYEYKCGEGTLWDSEIESCNHAWAVKQCGNGSKKDVTAISSSTEKNIITTISLIQTTTQKNIYEHEYDSGYGSVQRETTYPPTSSTERISNQGSNCKTTGFMGDDQDCKRFYRCVENGHGKYTRHEFTCGEGTVWDPEIEACNHAWAVKKCGGSGVIDNSVNQVTTSNSVLEDGSEDSNGYNKPNNSDKDSESPVNNIPTTVKTTTNNVETVPHKGKECATSGFMGDTDDCKIFYRCVENGNGGFVRYEFTCGDGTVWDPQISACNHAWAVEKCGASTPANQNNNQPTHIDSTTAQSKPIDGETTTKSSTEYSTSSSSTAFTITSDKETQCEANGFLGDKYDCRKFYRCVDDGKGSFLRYEFSCGEGTVWDSKIKACNHAWAVESCGNNASPVAAENSTTTNPTTMKDDDDNNYHTQNNQETSSSTESGSTVKSSTSVGDNVQCNTEGFMADTHDCKKFYRCVNDGRGNFIRYEFSCGDGTVWDSEINACNHVNAVKTHCSITSVQTTESSQSNNTLTTTLATDFSTTSKPLHNQQCEQEGFIGDKNDCKKFYRCTDNGQGGFNKHEFSCGEGTVWDQKILACNHASSDSQCSSSATATDTVPHPESSETSLTTSTTTSTSVSESPQKTETPLSKEECISEGFHANSNDCKKFFRCVDDGKGGFIKYDFTCGDGTVWVQDLQACDHESNHSYCNNKNNVITTSTPSYSTQEQPMTTSSAVTTSSTTNTYTSTMADEYTHKPASSSDDVCQSEGFYPNSKDCTKFYQCVNNGKSGYNKYEFSCSEGTAWDINSQSCNHISEVKSCQGSSQDEVQTKPTVQDESVSESSTTTENSKGSSTTSATTGDTCEESGYFGNSKDCKKFYRCVDNGKGGFTKYDYTCGDGTIWDQDITACNHPQDVTNPSCKNDETTTTTTTKTTTTPTTTTTEPSETTTKSSSTSSATQSTTEQNSNQSTQGSTTKKPNNNNYTCTEAGFYPDPYDCKKFYRCVDWGGDGKSFSIFHFDCAEGTIWDPALQTCNYEDSVYPPRDCSGNQSQNATETTEGTTAKQEETTESSTSEGTSTTTQKSSTDSSTTESASTTDQTSTQQSSNTEQTSTQKSTTQQSTTEQSTTQQSTTEQSTTQQSTTEQSSTQQSSTEQSTTEQSTTEKSTTQQSTTEQITTQQSTTEQSTTQQSTSEQSTSTTTEQSTTTTTTEQTTSSTEESTTTTQSTTSESTTNTAEQTTKADQTTTQESSTEESSENQSSTTESSTQESTDGSSTTESGQDTTTEKGSSDKECPETDDDQYLYVCPTGFKRHPKYCNLFYQCTEDDDSHEVKVAVFTCPNNTIYDESKIQCVEEEKAENKCDGQIAQKRRVKRLDSNYKEPIIVNRQTYSCPAVGHFPFDRNEECSPVLLKCEATKTGKLRGLVYQCPEGFVYWSISRRCELTNALTGCKPSLSDWTGRYEIPTERKNVARKK